MFAKAFAGGFLGKLTAALFIAICLTLGFGPDKWAKFIVTGLPTWVTPGRAQALFLALAALTFIALAWPILRRRIASFRLKKSVTSDEVAPAYEQRPTVRDWKTPLEAIEAFGNKFIRGERDRRKQEAAEISQQVVRAEEAIRQINNSYRGISPNTPPDVVANYDQWHAKLVESAFERDDAENGYKNASQSLLTQVVHELAQGNLIAKGFRMPRDGLGETEISQSEWRSLGLDPDMAEASSHGTIVFTGVLIGKPEAA